MPLLSENWVEAKPPIKKENLAPPMEGLEEDPRRKWIGRRFGRLIVCGEPTKEKESKVLVICDCGKMGMKFFRAMKNGRIKSCGCLRRENQRAVTHGLTRKGAPHSKILRAWHSMQERCHNPKNHAYKNYGGRGIVVCTRWRFGENGLSGFECFRMDIGNPPTKEHSMDRFPDKNGNYEPGNVRWATWVEQARNTRKNKLISLDGETKCLVEWLSEKKINASTFRRRMKMLGMTEEEALKCPNLTRMGRARYSLPFYDGKTHKKTGPKPKKINDTRTIL